MHLPILMAASLTDVAPGLIIWTLITFVILLVLLRQVAWKPILRMVEQRESGIRESLDAAARQQEETKLILDKAERDREEARREAAELVRKAQADLEKAREEQLARARQDAENLLASARRQIEEEQKKAFAEVKTVAVDLALQAAARLIEANMDEERQRRLVEDYLRNIKETRASS